METLFENTYTRDREWAKDCYSYICFRRPIVIVMDVLAGLYLAWGVYDLAVNSAINVLGIFPFFWAVMSVLLYRKNCKLTLQREFEVHGRPVEITTTLTNDGIAISQSTGAQYRVSFNDIKTVVQTKKYIYLWSKTNMFYSLKKDGFSVGNGEDLLHFLRNKGIKAK